MSKPRSGGIRNGRTCGRKLTFQQDVSSYIDVIMTTGRINSTESLRTAERVLRAFDGSWDAVEQAAERRSDGVFVIRRQHLVDRERRRGQI